MRLEVKKSINHEGMKTQSDYCHPEPFARHSEGAKRPKNLAQDKLREESPSEEILRLRLPPTRARLAKGGRMTSCISLCLGALVAIFCVFVVNVLLLSADAIYLKNGRTVEGKIISENEKSVTLEIGYGTITINRAYIKEVIAEEWTPPKPPKVLPPEKPAFVEATADKSVTPTPVSNIQSLLDSYAQTSQQKDINKILVQLLNLPADKEPWALFDELVSQSVNETEYLLLLLKEVQAAGILKWVMLSLGKHQVPAAVKPLFEILNGQDETLKLVVLDALRYMKDISTVHLLRVQLPKEKSTKVKTALINSLFIAEDKESLSLLVDYLDDPDNGVRKSTTNAIVAIARKLTVEELRASNLMGQLKEKVLSTKQKETREEIISIFGQLKIPEAVETLMAFLLDENAEIRSEAAIALGSIGDKKATNFLIERLQKEEDEWTKMQIIVALRQTNDSSVIPVLIETLRDDQEKVRICAARALRYMVPRQASLSEDYNKWKEWWEKESR